ncbi:MAG: FecR domain-containing protein [Planctomycetes bacterium]|nr:FecR domain-containing protein [Planctomycetota bacterium]
MGYRALLWVVVSWCLLVSTPAWSQEAPPPAAAPPAAAEPAAAPGHEDSGAGAAGAPEAPPAAEAKVVVKSLSGPADLLPRPDAEWTAAEVGMELSPGATLFTGSGCFALLQFADFSVVEVEPLTEMRMGEFLLAKADGEVRTRLQLRSGRVRVEIKESSYRSDMQIATPNATASVTGSGGLVGCGGGFGTTCRNDYGSWGLNGRPVGEGQNSKCDNAGKTSEGFQQQKAASNVDTGARGKTKDESQAQTNQGQSSSVLASDANRSEANPFFGRSVFQTSQAKGEKGAISQEHCRDPGQPCVPPPSTVGEP